ncbi:hypothetical protein AAFC00_006628 [Neodothiora populina]|uniref:F-box domain-containing protein n=1 Tax=Neodothiora populina TaxID=2781224 RepID=A0ABR3PAM8_9PEZI
MPSIGRLSRSSTSLSATPNDTEPANMKRRKSSVTSLKAMTLPFRSSKRKDMEMPATHAETAHSSLLSLPTEIQIQILQYCSFDDLCALRATSREVNQFVTGPYSSVSRYWISSKLHPVHRLYPVPPAGDLWTYLTAQMHRWNVARHLAEMIAYHIQYRTLLLVQRQSSSPILSASILAALLLPGAYAGQTNYHSAMKQVRFQPVALRLRRKMTPLLFTLSHYLSSCQQNLQSSQIAFYLSGEPTTFWNGIEAPERYTAYTRDQLFSTHYCWLFLDWMFKSLLSRPSYAGAIERTMRGWTSTPLDAPSLTQVLVHGNLSAIKTLMRLKDYGERKKWARNFLRTLDPEQSLQTWASAWENLDMRPQQQQKDSALPTRAQATAILRGPGKADVLWTRGAARRLSALGIELDENELHGNSATTMRFLTDLVGFDMFHEPPPEDLREDSDSDVEERSSSEENDCQARGGDRTPRRDPDDDDDDDEEGREYIDGLIDAGNYWDV